MMTAPAKRPTVVGVVVAVEAWAAAVAPGAGPEGVAEAEVDPGDGEDREDKPDTAFVLTKKRNGWMAG